MNADYEFLKSLSRVMNLPIEEVGRRVARAEFSGNPYSLEKGFFSRRQEREKPATDVSPPPDPTDEGSGPSPDSDPDHEAAINMAKRVTGMSAKEAIKFMNDLAEGSDPNNPELAAMELAPEEDAYAMKSLVEIFHMR